MLVEFTLWSDAPAQLVELSFPLLKDHGISTLVRVVALAHAPSFVNLGGIRRQQGIAESPDLVIRKDSDRPLDAIERRVAQRPSDAAPPGM